MDMGRIATRLLLFSSFARVSQTKQNNSVINLKFKNLFAATKQQKKCILPEKNYGGPT